MSGRAIISGGSIGGLFAASALRKGGWNVALYERTPVELAGRGAGIVTHKELIDALLAVGASIDDLGVAVEERVAFGIDGDTIRSIAHPQVVTSWDRVYQILRPLLPETSHHLGRCVSGYEQDADRVRVIFDDGRADEADILIGADGFRSAVRGQMLPDIRPVYSGYVVWRALIGESELSPAIRDQVFGAFGFYLPTGCQVIGYPIAGPGNNLSPGQRRYNFVWYSPVNEHNLADMLTDETGKTHLISIPPPLVREDVLERMMEDAENTLPAPFIEMLAGSERPFFTPIYDHHSPVMAEGRVALSGDAACVARPHVGMGVTKAAQDALALAKHLSGPNIEDGLQAYSSERVPASEAAFMRSRRLGSYMFIEPQGGHNRDGRSNPNLDVIMRETAVAGF